MFVSWINLVVRFLSVHGLGLSVWGPWGLLGCKSQGVKSLISLGDYIMVYDFFRVMFLFVIVCLRVWDLWLFVIVCSNMWGLSHGCMWEKCSLWSICGSMSLDVLDVPWCSPLFLFSSIPFSRERGKFSHLSNSIWPVIWGLKFICWYSPRICALSSLLSDIFQFERTLLCFWMFFPVYGVSDLFVVDTAGFEFFGILCLYVSGCEVPSLSVGEHHRRGCLICVCQGCNAWSDCAFMSQDVRTTAVCRHLSQDVRFLICWGMFVQGWDF